MSIQNAEGPVDPEIIGDDHMDSDEDVLRNNDQQRRRRGRPRQRFNRIQDRIEEDVENTNERIGSIQGGEDFEYREDEDDLVLEDEQEEQDELALSSDGDRRSFHENEEEKQQQEEARRLRLQRNNRNGDRNNRLGNAFDRLQDSVEGVFD